jgi:hypothetical protein
MAEKRPRSSSPSREDSQRQRKVPARETSPSLEASIMLELTEGTEEAADRGGPRQTVQSTHRPTTVAAAVTQLRRLLKEFSSSLTPQVQLCSAATPAPRPSCIRLGDPHRMLRDGDVDDAPVLARNPRHYRRQLRASESLGTHSPSLFPAFEMTTSSPGPKEASWAIVVSRKARHGHRVVRFPQFDSNGQPRLEAPEWLPERQWAQLPGSEINTSGARTGSIGILATHPSPVACTSASPPRSDTQKQ